MKYLLVLVVVWLGWQLLLRQRPPENSSGKRPDNPPPRQAPPKKMVACQRCGTHLPLDDALPGRSPGTYYCCAEHRDADPLDVPKP